MKCVLLLLAFVTLCYSHPYGHTGGRSVNINEDGTIVITSANGKRVTIMKGPGHKNIEIDISGPNIPTKRIQINEQNDLRDVNLLEDSTGRGEFEVGDEYQRDKRSSKKRPQGETLAEILREYQGTVDDTSYDQLLKKIKSAVRSGQLSESVYDVLQGLEGQSQIGGQGIGSQEAQVWQLLQRQQQLEDLLKQQFQQQQQFQQGRQSGFPSVVDQIVSPRIGNQFGIQGRVIGTTTQGVVLEVPVQTQQGQSMQRVLLGQQQGFSPRTVPGLTCLDGNCGMILDRSRGGLRTIWEDVLNNFNAQQRGGITTGQLGQQGTLSQIIENESEIFQQQREIQQQQLQQQLLQQQQQQQILQQQLQQQQLQQQLQQQQQQQDQLQEQIWQQQQQQQQDQLEQQILQQQQQQQNEFQQQQIGGWNENLVTRPIQTRGRQQLTGWQQLGVFPRFQQTGVSGTQGIPLTRYNVPLVL